MSKITVKGYKSPNHEQETSFQMFRGCALQQIPPCGSHIVLTWTNVAPAVSLKGHEHNPVIKPLKAHVLGSELET